MSTAAHFASQGRARALHERYVRREALRRGLRIEKLGAVWRIVGPGVDVRVADLRSIRATDLQPPFDDDDDQH